MVRAPRVMVWSYDVGHPRPRVAPSGTTARIPLRDWTTELPHWAFIQLTHMVAGGPVDKVRLFRWRSTSAHESY